MPEMKNVYNLITDAFSGLGHQEHRESEYFIDVVYTETFPRSYKITIRSRNPNATGSALLTLIMDHANRLIDFTDTNDLFLNDNWDRFCNVFEDQIHYSSQVHNIITSIN